MDVQIFRVNDIKIDRHEHETFATVRVTVSDKDFNKSEITLFTDKDHTPDYFIVGESE